MGRLPCGFKACGRAIGFQGDMLHRTATLAFVEASLWGATGQLCAQASGTFKYVRRQSAPARLSADPVPLAD